MKEEARPDVYEVPVIEVIEVEIEQDFQASGPIRSGGLSL